MEGKEKEERKNKEHRKEGKEERMKEGKEEILLETALAQAQHKENKDA